MYMCTTATAVAFWPNSTLHWQGLQYIHSSPLLSHGHLSSDNCEINNRWVLKITNYGVQHLRKFHRTIDEVGRVQKYKGRKLMNILCNQIPYSHITCVQPKSLKITFWANPQPRPNICKLCPLWLGLALNTWNPVTILTRACHWNLLVYRQCDMVIYCTYCPCIGMSSTVYNPNCMACLLSWFKKCCGQLQSYCACQRKNR